MTPEQETEAEQWLGRQHWAKDPCPEHPGWSVNDCIWCGGPPATTFLSMKTGPLDAQSRFEIKTQTGVEMKDWSEYRGYLKRHNLEGGTDRGTADYTRRKDMDEWVAAGGSSSGVPLPESCRVRKPTRNPVDIKEIYRQTKERYGKRQEQDDE